MIGRSKGRDAMQEWFKCAPTGGRKREAGFGREGEGAGGVGVDGWYREKKGWVVR